VRHCDLMDARIVSIFGYDLTWLTYFGRLFASEKNHLLFSFESCQAGEQSPSLGGVRGWGDAISKRRAEGIPPLAILLFLPISKRMTFSLFSLLTINVPVVFMARYVMILRGATSL